MTAKTDTKNAEATETKKAAKRQVSGTVPQELYNDLEGYAYGTRRKLSQVVSDALHEYYETHKKDIDAKKVD